MTTEKLKAANQMANDIDTLQGMIGILINRHSGIFNGERAEAECFNELRHGDILRDEIIRILETEVERIQKAFTML